MNRLFAAFVLSLTLATPSAYAIEVFCKNLTRVTENMSYTRAEIQTTSGPTVTFLPYPAQSVRAKPSRHLSGAGDRGQNLLPGECAFKTAPIAARYTELIFHFVGGRSFRSTSGADGNTAGWEELSSSCCKAFSFEAELTPNGTLLRATVPLSQTTVTYY